MLNKLSTILIHLLKIVLTLINKFHSKCKEERVIAPLKVCLVNMLPISKFCKGTMANVLKMLYYYKNYFNGKKNSIGSRNIVLFLVNTNIYNFYKYGYNGNENKIKFMALFFYLLLDSHLISLLYIIFLAFPVTVFRC